jgi:hypothetical protein
MTDTQQISVVHSDGGLSGLAHLLHLIATVLTAGLWLPVYVVAYWIAPARRAQVIAPAGTSPEMIESVRAEAESLSPGERLYVRRYRLKVLTIALSPIIAVVLVFVGLWLLF